MKRLFSKRERMTLYLASSGRCKICGTSLGLSMEADHIKPFSAGGETTLVNGQALCRKCNRGKGAK